MNSKPIIVDLGCGRYKIKNSIVEDDDWGNLDN